MCCESKLGTAVQRTPTLAAQGCPDARLSAWTTSLSRFAGLFPIPDWTDTGFATPIILDPRPGNTRLCGEARWAQGRRSQPAPHRVHAASVLG